MTNPDPTPAAREAAWWIKRTVKDAAMVLGVLIVVGAIIFAVVALTSCSTICSFDPYTMPVRGRCLEL